MRPLAGFGTPDESIGAGRQIDVGVAVFGGDLHRLPFFGVPVVGLEHAGAECELSPIVGLLLGLLEAAR